MRSSSEEREYKKICDAIDKEAKETGQYVCFFSGEPIVGKADHHHLLGRDGDLFADRNLIVLAKREHHRAWHDKGLEYCSQQPWWDDFLIRLKMKSEYLYGKVIDKLNK